MKATGIVRRIDDLGRVVIPKEIRRAMNIKEGDPLELYTEGKFVCLKKYVIERNWNKAKAVANIMFLNNFFKGEYEFALYDEDFARKATTDSGSFAENGCNIEADFIYKIELDKEIIGWLAVNFDDNEDIVMDIAEVIAETLREDD